MIRTTPWRRTTLHLSQIRFTDALTFITLVLQLCPRAGCSLLPPNDPAATAVSRTQLDQHPVSNHEPHEIAAQAGRRMRRNLPTFHGHTV
jgi:hypothetical protein